MSQDSAPSGSASQEGQRHSVDELVAEVLRRERPMALASLRAGIQRMQQLGLLTERELAIALADAVEREKKDGLPRVFDDVRCDVCGKGPAKRVMDKNGCPYYACLACGEGFYTYEQAMSADFLRIKREGRIVPGGSHV